MNRWLIQQRNALLLALRRITGAPVNTALTLLTFGIALALPAGGLIVYLQAQQAAHGSSALPQISVFMRLDADRKAAHDTEFVAQTRPCCRFGGISFPESPRWQECASQKGWPM